MTEKGRGGLTTCKIFENQHLASLIVIHLEQAHMPTNLFQRIEFIVKLDFSRCQYFVRTKRRNHIETREDSGCIVLYS